jgi:cytochrome c biogenesis protein CcmG/thiol:disulfide interchange protein DsbE
MAGLAVATLAWGGCTATGGEGEPLPDVIVLEFGHDRPVDVSSLRGPMVVNLWGSYCDPCRREMPVLQRFHEEHGDEVGVVGVDYQDLQQDEARELVAETGVTYRLLADPDGELNGADPLPNIMALPFTVLVDEDGNVAYMEYAEVSSVGQLEDLVSEHLGVDL